MSAEFRTSINPAERGSNIVQQRAIKMAILFEVKDGCKDCSIMDKKAHTHSVAVVESGRSAREAIESFNPFPDSGPCPGPEKVIGQSGDGCLPKYKCGMLGSLVLENV